MFMPISMLVMDKTRDFLNYRNFIFFPYVGKL